MKVADIRVGKRFRKDVGEVRSLAASINSLGLLHPIVVDGSRRLVAGARRLAAVKLLGWTDVPVRVVQTLSDAANDIRAERDENAERRQFLPSEMVAIARALEPLERAEAKRRQTQGGRPKKGTTKRSGKFPDHLTGTTRDRVGRVVGVSGRTLDKARAVVEAAERDPDQYGRVLRQMDTTGNVHGAYRVLQKLQDAEAVATNAQRFPTGRFDVIVCDPAWRYAIRATDPTQRGNTPYHDMSLEDICSLPVADIASDDCIMWLWTTNLHMRDAFTVLTAWNLEPRTILTWGKPRLGIGTWLRGQTEHAILAVRGQPKIRLTNQSTLLLAPAGPHSAKPDEFYQLVEEMCPGTKLDVFARRPRTGWTVWGNGVSNPTAGLTAYSTHPDHPFRPIVITCSISS